MWSAKNIFCVYTLMSTISDNWMGCLQTLIIISEYIVFYPHEL